MPGQTLQEWKEELEIAAVQNPEHISVYQLIIEEGTPFYEKYAEHPELLLMKKPAGKSTFGQADF